MAKIATPLVFRDSVSTTKTLSGHHVEQPGFHDHGAAQPHSSLEGRITNVNERSQFKVGSLRATLTDMSKVSSLRSAVSPVNCCFGF
jgi:hypothetical protein